MLASFFNEVFHKNGQTLRAAPFLVIAFFFCAYLDLLSAHKIKFALTQKFQRRKGKDSTLLALNPAAHKAVYALLPFFYRANLFCFCFIKMGSTGFEPVTFRVWGGRATTAPTAHIINFTAFIFGLRGQRGCVRRTNLNLVSTAPTAQNTINLLYIFYHIKSLIKMSLNIKVR